MCSSKLRILRAASVHYPALRKLLHGVYLARKHHSTVAEIDNALCTNDYKTLCTMMCNEECEDLIGETLKSKMPTSLQSFLLRVWLILRVMYASVFEQYKEKLDEDYEYPCSSCERLHKTTYVTIYTANTKKFDSAKWRAKWRQLKQYLSEMDDDFDSKKYFICKHCWPLLPATCILNGLYVEEIPNEFSQLNALGRQLVQRIKLFQTIIRLGTYTRKVPIYTAL